MEARSTEARSAVTKIRISAHNSPIERGRYKNIVRNDRVCTICDQNVMGNEIHYVMFCSNTLMAEERETFFRDIYKINTLLQVLDLDSLFYYILSMKDENIIKRNSNYCLKIIEIYDEVVI